MEVTATEFRTNLGHYLDLSGKEEIWIRKNGIRVARLVGVNSSSVDAISGILKEASSGPIDRHTIREKRLSAHEVHD